MEKDKNFDISFYPLKTLQELADVVSGVSVPSKQRLNAGIWQLIRGRNIVEGTVLPSDIFVPEEIVKKHPKGMIVPGDILISTLFEKYKVGVVPNNFGPSFTDSGIVKIRPIEVTQKYLVSFLSTKFGKSTLLEQLLKSTRGNVIKFITVNDIRKLKIPILPSDILETLNVEVSQKRTLEELQIVRLKYEKEILKAIRSMLLEKGWSEGDINFESRISGSLMADILLRHKGKPVALIEIKKDVRNIKSVIQQIQLMCKAANIRFGYLVSESGLMEISCLENKVIERKDFPSPEELKNE